MFIPQSEDYLFNVGDQVWIIDDNLVVIECRISKQEWWASNTIHPVYYSVVDCSGKPIGTSPTGNFHFVEIFRSAGEAEIVLKCYEK